MNAFQYRQQAARDDESRRLFVGFDQAVADEDQEYVACMIVAGWVDPPPIYPSWRPGGVTWL